MPNNAQTAPVIPPDDVSRPIRIARPETDASLRHLGLVGDTYTILLDGEDTAGRYCLIDMHVPPGGGPPPHRHNFEESFTILDGEVEFSFRDIQSTVRAGETVHIPANAPHHFQNKSTTPARLLCLCSPAGQEDFFLQVGVPVATRTAAAPKLDAAREQEAKQKAEALAPRYQTELQPRS